jgi:metal-responsive CopG/Arc/MetJ family transcriptional regulator
VPIKKNESDPNVTISFVLPKSMLKCVDSCTIYLGRNRSYVLRRAIRDFIKNLIKEGF